jgi:murein DD-endopeptidase MepM/ murein hydrolase activator NlpD
VFIAYLLVALLNAQTLVPPSVDEQAVMGFPLVATEAKLSGIRNHTVVAGENLSVIAEKYGIDIETIKGANPDIDELIYPGTDLVILPEKGVAHVVAAGETLWQIARLYGISEERILKVNNKTDDQLTISEKLIIPGGRMLSAVSRASYSRFSWPARGEITSRFGYRWGRLHSGVDIAGDYGTAVRAARTGQVSFAGWWGGYGYLVIIEHGQGFATLYGHLDDYFVNNGQPVVAGQLIGNIGNTGNSYGPHLHFEIRVGEQPVNPLEYLP